MKDKNLVQMYNEAVNVPTIRWSVDAFDSAANASELTDEFNNIATDILSALQNDKELNQQWEQLTKNVDAKYAAYRKVCQKEFKLDNKKITNVDGAIADLMESIEPEDIGFIDLILMNR